MQNILIELEERDILSLKCERAMLVEIQDEKESSLDAKNHLNELKSLVGTMGIGIVDEMIVKLRKKEAGWLITKGKREEILEFADAAQADLIVIDTELTPTQQRNLEKYFNICTIDRQEVILDIFADRASTKEAILQIALARMEYSLPRLTRAWTHLSRQRGGAKGTRGKGETQLETDQRLVQDKISKLKQEIKKVRKNREIQKRNRDELPVPVAAVIGYTNAGKSSLLNLLAGSDVLAEDKLFATLDPTSRRIELNGGFEMVLTDTVGFVRKLPHDLIDAFKSTLETAASAHLLIHVVDGSSAEFEDHIEVTRNVMKELDGQDIPEIIVFNKCDLFDSDREREIKLLFPNSLIISTYQKKGIEELLKEVTSELERRFKRYKMLIPNTRWDLLSALKRRSVIFSEEYLEEGILVELTLSEKDSSKLKEYIQ